MSLVSVAAAVVSAGRQATSSAASSSSGAESRRSATTLSSTLSSTPSKEAESQQSSAPSSPPPLSMSESASVVASTPAHGRGVASTSPQLSPSPRAVTATAAPAKTLTGRVAKVARSSSGQMTTRASSSAAVAVPAVSKPGGGGAGAAGQKGKGDAIVAEKAAVLARKESRKEKKLRKEAEEREKRIGIQKTQQPGTAARPARQQRHQSASSPPSESQQQPPSRSSTESFEHSGGSRSGGTSPSDAVGLSQRFSKVMVPCAFENCACKGAPKAYGDALKHFRAQCGSRFQRIAARKAQFKRFQSTAVVAAQRKPLGLSEADLAAFGKAVALCDLCGLPYSESHSASLRPCPRPCREIVAERTITVASSDQVVAANAGSFTDKVRQSRQRPDRVQQRPSAPAAPAQSSARMEDFHVRVEPMPYRISVTDANGGGEGDSDGETAAAAFGAGKDVASSLSPELLESLVDLVENSQIAVFRDVPERFKANLQKAMVATLKVFAEGKSVAECDEAGVMFMLAPAMMQRKTKSGLLIRERFRKFLAKDYQALAEDFLANGVQCQPMSADGQEQAAQDRHVFLSPDGRRHRRGRGRSSSAVGRGAGSGGPGRGRGRGRGGGRARGRGRGRGRESRQSRVAGDTGESPRENEVDPRPRNSSNARGGGGSAAREDDENPLIVNVDADDDVDDGEVPTDGDGQHEPEDLDPSIQRNIAWSMALVREGEVGRAYRFLGSLGKAEPNQETFDQLLLRHPACAALDASDSDLKLPEGTEAFQALDVQVEKALRLAARKSSAGPTGMTFDHLQLLNSEGVEYLTKFINRLYEG